MGFGASIISRLLKTNIKRNLFFTIKDKVFEERISGGHSVRRTQKVKVYGSDSTHEEREKLMDILRNRIDFHKDKIISKTIYDELCGLEVKKNGRIQHSSVTHDDQVFSWLWALYIIYEGGDLMRNWGIARHEIRTDADLEEAVYDFEHDQELVKIDMDTPVEADVLIEDQQKVLDQAPGKMLYKQWVESEIQKDKDCLARLMQDPVARRAYAQQMHLNEEELGKENIVLTPLPNSVFLSSEPSDIDQYSVDQGNLSSGLMGRNYKVF